MAIQLILASGSPRRRELFERFWGGNRFKVMAPDFDESQVPPAMQDNANELTRYLAAGKLNALRKQFTLPDNFVAVAADTVVVLDEHILGKPADPADAAEMLSRLSGRTHEVRTGISVMLAHRPDEPVVLQEVETTRVRFSQLDDQMIRWYVSTGEPMDKAGAYGIQGHGAALIERIDGCYYNVMGLPVYRLMDLLRQLAGQFTSTPGLSDLLPWN